MLTFTFEVSGFCKSSKGKEAKENPFSPNGHERWPLLLLIVNFKIE